MPFLVICRASGDVTPLRRRARRAHLQYMIAHRGEIVHGGAILSPETGEMVGMLLVMDLPTRQRVDGFLREEPYCAAGMFTEIRVEPWDQKVPEPTADYLRLELEREIARDQEAEAAQGSRTL